MKSKIFLALAIISVTVSAAFAQNPTAATTKLETAPKLPTVQLVLANYVKAIGGREAVEKIKSRQAKGTVEMQPMGLKGTFESIAASGDRSLTKMNLAGIGDLVEGYDGKVAWTVNPIQGNREKSGAELLQAKLNNEFYRDVRMDKIYPKMELTGVEKVNGKDAYVIRAEPVGLNPDTLYFDVATGLLVRMDSQIVSPEGVQAAKMFYEDYRNSDGVMIPHKTRTVTPQVEIVMNFTEFKSNVPVDDAKFARPKS